MSDLIILRYTDEARLDLVHDVFTDLKKVAPNKIIVALPYSIDILEDCSLEQLYEVKNIIDNAIKEMEKENG